jgi:hypothetical protein
MHLPVFSLLLLALLHAAHHVVEAPVICLHLVSQLLQRQLHLVIRHSPDGPLAGGIKLDFAISLDLHAILRGLVLLFLVLGFRHLA